MKINRNYHNINIDNIASLGIENDIPTIILISSNCIDKINYLEFFKEIRKYHLVWLIFIGKNAKWLEDEFDYLLEAEADENEYFLNVITTSYQYDTINNLIIDDILHQFLIMACSNQENCQFISFLNIKNNDDKRIFEEIMKGTEVD